MKSLRTLCVAISLTIVLAGTALADGPIPGETNTPPCNVMQQQGAEDLANQTTTTSSSAVEILWVDTVFSALEDLLTVY